MYKERDYYMKWRSQSRFVWMQLRVIYTGARTDARTHKITQ